MNKILLFILVIGLAFGLTGCIDGEKNSPPNAPSIEIPVEAEINEEVEITVTSTDLDGNEIAYKIRYGDGVDSDWSVYFPSGQETTFTHKYEEARDYRVKAVASDRQAIGEWSEDKWIKIKTDIPPPEPRLISILGTCLPGCEQMMKDLGFTHAYGNRYGWPDYDLVESLGMKVFVNIRADDWRFSLEEQQELSRLREYVKSNVTRAKITNNINLLATSQYQSNLTRYKDLLLKSIPNEGEIQRAVNAWKDRLGCGGYWADTLGHEPDICGQPMEERIQFYNTVRKYDPDKQARPVMEMFDMTEWNDFPNNQYPGWKNTFSDDPPTNDLLLVDCYPNMSLSNEEMIDQMEHAWNRFIKVYPHKNQVIIQMIANNNKYDQGEIWLQYNFWKEKLASAEFDNPYRGSTGVCFYSDLMIRQNGEMQQEIKQINEDIIRQGK